MFFKLDESGFSFIHKLLQEDLGLPLPMVGSLHYAARKSARPCSAFSALVCRLWRPCFGSSAALLGFFQASGLGFGPKTAFYSLR